MAFIYFLAAEVNSYNAFNVYCRELAPGTVSLTGYRAQGDDGKHCAYYSLDMLFDCVRVR